MVHIDYGLSNAPQWIGSSSFVKPDLSGRVQWFTQESNPFGFLISSTLGSIYTISFVILINLVLTSIITGIIIDTFSAMREESDRIEEDIRSNCFICSIARYPTLCVFLHLIIT
jgi:hypothetical protein